jgi:tellurite resistance protein
MTKPPTTRIALGTFAIPLGLTGLAELWSDAGAALHLPVALTEPFWIVAAIALVWTIVAHTVRGARSEATFASQLKHPAQGPVAAMLPIIGMLLGINLHGYWSVGGTVLILVSMAAATLFAGWLVAFLLRGELSLDPVHGGYFLATVAASFVAGGAASVIGADALAIGAFAVGAFFWVVMFALVAGRLAFRPALPGPLVPTMAVLMAPPAVAGLSWFAYNHGGIDPVEQGLIGLAVFSVLVQVFFLPRYLRLAFSLGFWSFTFPTAFVGAYIIVWISKSPFDGWQVLAYAILVLATALVLAIAVFSIREAIRTRRYAAGSA